MTAPRRRSDSAILEYDWPIPVPAGGRHPSPELPENLNDRDKSPLLLRA